MMTMGRPLHSGRSMGYGCSARNMMHAVAAVAVLAAVGMGMYEANSPVTQLSAANFDRLVVKSSVPFLVEMYAPWCGHCKSLQPEYELTAKTLQGKIKVGAIDLDQESNNAIKAKYNVKGFPTILLFVNGKPITYNGARTSSAIVKFCLKQLPSKVVSITDSSFEKFVAGSTLPKAILFTKAKKTSALYKGLSLTFSDRMILGEVNKAQKDLVKRFDIRSFPSVLVLPSDYPASEYIEMSSSEEINQMTLTKFFKRYALPDPDYISVVPQLSDQSCFSRYCLTAGVPLCVLLLVSPEDYPDEKAKYLSILEETAESRSISNANMFSFGWIDGKQQSEFVKEMFGLNQIDAYPPLIAFSPKKERFATFVRAFSEEGIASFLNGLVSGRVSTRPINAQSMPKLVSGPTENCPAPPKPEIPKAKTKSKSPPKQKSSRPSGNANFNVQLTDKNFDNIVLKSNSIWIVEFMAPWCGHCQQLAAPWSKAANGLKGIVQFGVVDATENQQLASKYDVKGYPTIKVFGENKKAMPQDYQGARTAKAISKFAVESLPNYVTRIKPDALDNFTKKGPFPKVILITDKSTTPPVAKSLALKFKDKLPIGVVKSSESVLNSLGVAKAPAFVVIQSDSSVVPYTGEPFMPALSEQFSSLVSGTSPKKPSVEMPKKDSSSSDAAVTSPVTTQAEFDDACVSRPGLCVLAFFDSINDDVSRYLTIFEESASRLSNGLFRYLTVNRTNHSKFAETFRLSDAMPVNVVALHANKKRYAVFRGAFSADSIVLFLESVSLGKLPTSALDAIPSFGEHAGGSCLGASQTELGEDSGQCTAPPTQQAFTAKPSAKDEL